MNPLNTLTLQQIAELAPKPDDLAKDILSVQPMDITVIKSLEDALRIYGQPSFGVDMAAIAAHDFLKSGKAEVETDK